MDGPRPGPDAQLAQQRVGAEIGIGRLLQAEVVDGHHGDGGTEPPAAAPLLGKAGQRQLPRLQRRRRHPAAQAHRGGRGQGNRMPAQQTRPPRRSPTWLDRPRVACLSLDAGL